MRTLLRWIPACLLAALAAVASAQTSTNSISLQAKLTGVPDGTVNLTVKFYDALAGGTQQGATISLNAVPVQGGIVSVPVSPVDPTVFNGATRYMGISVNGGAELSPRTLVTSVPYATSSTQLVSPASGRRLVQLSSDGVVIGGTPNESNLVKLLVNAGTGDPTAVVVQQNFLAANVDEPRQLAISGLTADGFGAEPTLSLGVHNARNFAAISVQGTSNTRRPLVLNPLGGGVAIGGTETLGSTLSVHGQTICQYDSGGSLNTAGAVFRMINNGVYYGEMRINDKRENILDATVFPLRFELPDGATLFSVSLGGVTTTRVLTITGGSDIAEPVAITPTAAISKAEPGMVMVIDREHDGKLVPCSAAYDRAVAGVLSGANGLKPGMVLSAEGQPHTAAGNDTMPLAMTGRVWVMCDASHGAIHRGDSLTTSMTPGHAMVATDDARASRAVIGKAMTELVEGRGMVLVLVNLQ